MADDTGEWLEFYISDADSGGVDGNLLANLISDFSAAVYVAARRRLGLPTTRRGRPSGAERRLAAVRVLSVTPGSLHLAFREPPHIEVAQLALLSPSTPDDVVSDLVDAIEATLHGNVAYRVEGDLERYAERLIKRAGVIGEFATITHRPSGQPPRTISIRLRERVDRDDALETRREVTLFGHTYMVDVELGRQRLRVKLPNEADVTMEIDRELIETAEAVLNRPVRLTVEEMMRDGIVVRRTIRRIELLSLVAEGPVNPPKSARELALEQGIFLRGRPDWRALASNIWRTREEVADAEEYFQAARRASA